jgi:hypothetical protein
VEVVALVYVEWLHRSHVYGGRVYHTCGWPPRSKEIGDIHVMKLLVQPQVKWALSWSIKLRELSQTDRGWYKLVGWSTSGLVWGIASERSLLSLHLPIWAKWASWEKGMTKSCGKSAPSLRSVRTKYLVVSPVTDNSERCDIEPVRESPHPNFLKLKLDG